MAEVRGLARGAMPLSFTRSAHVHPTLVRRVITSTPPMRSMALSIPTGGRERGEATGGHGGDLPNIYAASDGFARADFFTDGITLDSDLSHSVFDADGSAIIVHEKPDAYGEEESDTGSRVACGVIRRG